MDADRIDAYDYDLPKHLIAQSPVERRDDSRLMVVERVGGRIEHRHMRDLPEILQAGDLLVLNDTKVVPAQLVGLRESTRGRWSGLFLESGEQGVWRVLGKTRGKMAAGETVILQDRQGAERLRLRILAKLEDGAWAVKPETDLPTEQVLELVGRVPLPHYIRGGSMVDSDLKDYQTVYATAPGSVAAPTAGLHFTKELLQRLVDRSVKLARVTLHVGIGTFRPVSVEQLSQHQMHSEWGSVGQGAVDELKHCRQRQGRVIAVGTTSARLLETHAAKDPLQPWEGNTDLFIRPPFQFRAVDGLLTNFHLPRSTLLVLVRTFGGDELMRRAYQEAIAEKYRFFSYGDAMLIL